MKKKIAVLHAQIPFVRGGAELMVESLVKQLKQRGFEADLISMPFKWYPEASTLMDSYLMWRMADLTEVDGAKIDLVIATKAPTYLLPHPNKVVWLMNQHRPAYDLHDSVPVGGFNVNPNEEKYRDVIVRMDNKGINEAKEVYSISKVVSNRFEHYNHIHSTPLYHPPALAGRYRSEEYGAYVLAVGRLDSQKRQNLLIQALPFCDKNVRAVIAGDGKDLEWLQKLAVEKGVEDRVDFLGFVSDDALLKLYANALTVCVTPVDEDYCYITLEAFLSKRPVITCGDSSGVLEFARQEENAIVCDCENPEEIGSAINTLYHDKGVARGYGENGYNMVKDISWENVISELTKTVR